MAERHDRPRGLPFAQRLQNLRRDAWWFVVRIIQRLLSGSRGEVSALEQALRLQERLVIVAMVVASVFPALLLLAYFAFTASDPVSYETESRQPAEEAAEKLLADVSKPMENFKSELERRLAVGASPLLRLDQLHPHLRVALQFDKKNELVAPFKQDVPQGYEDAEVLLRGPYARAAALDAAGGPPEPILSAYEAVARNTMARGTRGLAHLGRGRLLARLGRKDEAVAAFKQAAEDAGDARDPWGFRIEDLARYETASLQMKSSQEEGATAARALVEDLLAENWIVGRGGEAAIARRALSLIPTSVREQAWAADASNRVKERTGLLFWAERLMRESAVILNKSSEIPPSGNDVRWELGTRALWAIRPTRDGGLLAFAFDWNTIREDLNDRARGFLARDGSLTAWLKVPAEAEEDSTDADLATKPLPWLPGASLVIRKGPRFDSEAAARARQIWLRNAAVLLSLATLVLGVLFTVRLVNRELDLAQLKTRFAANVSHELRSPLTQIRLKAEALTLGLAETPEEQQEYYRAIVRESERLGRLVDDVLDYAVLPSGRNNLAPRVRMGSMVDTVYRALDSIRASEEVRRMELDVDLPDDLPVVAHDADAVVRCVINLVSNAAKYSKESNWIGIRARAVDGAVEVSVSDRGIGIHPNELDKIFDPFVRSADPRVGTKKGAGLGLTMTAEIMKAHGGKVLVQSRLGKGSTFTLRFPLSSHPQHSRTADPSRDTHR